MNTSFHYSLFFPSQSAFTGITPGLLINTSLYSVNGSSCLQHFQGEKLSVISPSTKKPIHQKHTHTHTQWENNTGVLCAPRLLFMAWTETRFLENKIRERKPSFHPESSIPLTLNRTELYSSSSVREHRERERISLEACSFLNSGWTAAGVRLVNHRDT